MAALGKAFGMKVMVYTRSAAEEPANVDVFLCAERGDSIDPLLEDSRT